MSFSGKSASAFQFWPVVYLCPGLPHCTRNCCHWAPTWIVSTPSNHPSRLWWHWIRMVCMSHRGWKHGCTSLLCLTVLSQEFLFRIAVRMSGHRFCICLRCVFRLEFFRLLRIRCCCLGCIFVCCCLVIIVCSVVAFRYRLVYRLCILYLLLFHHFLLLLLRILLKIFDLRAKILLFINHTYFHSLYLSDYLFYIIIYIYNSYIYFIIFYFLL